MSHEHDHHHDNQDAPALEEDGKVYFRSVEELEQAPEIRDFLEKEFPGGVEKIDDPVSRREFLSLMGASIGLAGMGSGCIRRPEEHIVPYAKRPEEVIPGLPNYYATVLSFSGQVTGLVVEAHEGRPTKIEGNPFHPASAGAACSIEQAGILGLYDPDRVTTPFKGEAPSDLAAFDAFFGQRLEELKGRQGQGLYVLHQQYASPTFRAVAGKVRQAFPQAQVLEWEAISDDEVRAGARIAFGEPVEAIYRADAHSILAVDCDLLASGPFHLRHAKDFASRRDPEVADEERPFSRLWVAEATLSITGAAADHRIRIRASEAGAFLRVLAAKLVTAGIEVPAGIAASGDGGFDPRFMTLVAAELAAKKGKGFIAVGRHQPAEVQAIGHALNEAIHANFKSVEFARVADPDRVPHAEAIRRLTASLAAGQVDTLVILGGNPAFDAPADLDLAAALKRASHVIHLAPERNETAQLASWVVPQTHFLEAWGDAQTSEGSWSIQQPLITPIWGGRSPIEMMARIAGMASPSGHELVRANFLESGGSDATWLRTLHDGIEASSPGKFVKPVLNAAAIGQAAASVPEASPPATLQAMELVLFADGKVWDGRFANNGWLQELPDPVSKLSWSNAALLSPATAAALGVKNRDMVRVELDGRVLDIPVWLQPGQADNVVAIAVGYGRRAAGRVGDGRGFNAYALRTTKARHVGRGAKVTPGTGTFLLASMQDHDSMEGRPIVRESTLAKFATDPSFATPEMVHHPELLSLWKDHQYTGQQWGMTIDLSRCIGCNGCMTACQAENNIPIVGPEQLQKGREMFWIRLDRYYASKNPDDPHDMSEVEVVHQPVTCQQCENAPCENVCPVAATTHSTDGGLNDMVYNRCVGTRYCSNNCPYKVRRFNYFDWHEQGVGQRGQAITHVEKMKFNPDVTVRTRGVMEKCTYCIQRIHAAKRTSKNAGLTSVPDGDIVPACVQACPAEAIAFGDVRDPQSRVSVLKGRDRNYSLLEELNTRPRTTYLAKIRNPHPEMVKS